MVWIIIYNTEDGIVPLMAFDFIHDALTFKKSIQPNYKEELSIVGVKKMTFTHAVETPSQDKEYLKDIAP